MTRFPPEFREEYDSKRESFHSIAEIVLSNHGKQLTADEIAEQVGPERAGVQDHLRTLEADGWVQTIDGPQGYTWDTQKYNPAEYQGQVAVNSVMSDALAMIKRASGSWPELFAFLAILGLATGIVLTSSAVLAMVLPVGVESPSIFATIGMGYAVGALIMLGVVEAWAQFRRRLA